MIFVRSCKIQMRSNCQQFYSNSMYLLEEWWLSCENWESTGASLLFNAERGSDSWSWVFGVSRCLCTAWVDGIQSLSWMVIVFEDLTEVFWCFWQFLVSPRGILKQGLIDQEHKQLAILRGLTTSSILAVTGSCWKPRSGGFDLRILCDC